MVESFLIPYDLDRDVFACLVVQGADHLAEGALANDLEDLVPVRDVVVQHLVVGAIVVVETTVLRRAFFPMDLGRLVPEVPHLWVAFDLLALVLGQAGPVVLKGLGWSERE